MNLLIITIVTSSIMYFVPPFLWNKKYGAKYIDIHLLPLRRKYRICSAFGLMLLLVSTMYLAYDDAGYFTWLIIPCIFMSNNRLFFEPYHTSDIVDKIDKICLYLRPFNVLTYNDKDWAKGKMGISESIEKLLCDELNKRIAKTYCIGDPNAAIPTTLSASGIYASDNEWKSTVTNLAEKSSVIVLKVMDTEGCLWELQHCINYHIDKTIFIVTEKKHLVLLNEYIIGKCIDIPDIEITQHCIFLYLDNNNNSWNAFAIKKNRDIKTMITNFIDNHDVLKKEICHRNDLKTILKEPFLQKNNFSKLSHWFTYFMQTFWYVVYNRWPKPWLIIYILYELLIITLSTTLYISYESETILILLYLSFSFPWLWLAPQISMTFNSWGSKYIADKGNVILSKWAVVYTILTFVLGIYFEPVNYKEEIPSLVENIMVEGKHNEYKPINIHIDSTLSSVYTDMDVMSSFMQFFVYSNTTSDEDYEKEVYDDLMFELIESVASVEWNTHIGWTVNHKYSYVNEYGDVVDDQCIIFFDKKCINYHLFSIDESGNYYSYKEYMERIDIIVDVLAEFEESSIN